MISFNVINLILSGLLATGSAYSVYRYFQKQKKSALQKNLVVATAFFTFFISFVVLHLMLKPYYQEMALKHFINKNPLMESIETYYPTEYQQWMNSIGTRLQNKEEQRILVQDSYHFANRLFLVSLQHASDKTIVEYVATIIPFYQYLYKQDPALILKVENADASISIDLAFLRSEPEFEKLFTQLLKARNAIIQSATQEPVKGADVNTAATLFASLVVQLETKYGREVVAAAFNPDDKTVPAKTKAEVIIDFYHILNRSEPPIAGQIMRYIGKLATQQT